MKSKINGRLTQGERVFLIVNNIILILVCLIMLYPVLYVLGRSVTPELERALHQARRL